MRFLRPRSMLFALVTFLGTVVSAAETDLAISTDPLTRYFYISYLVAANAPNEISVACTWRPAGTSPWRPARGQALRLRNRPGAGAGR